MRKLLNTLFVTKENMMLSRDGSNIVIKLDGEKVFQTPIQYLENVVCFTYVGLTSSLMELSMENNVSITFLSPWGKYRGKVEGPTKGNVLLRKEQYRISENKEEALAFAKLFILGKIYNSHIALGRAARDYNIIEKNYQDNLISLKDSKKEILQCESSESLFGIEGDASRSYFQCFAKLIRNDQFNFDHRNRRPPIDEMNAMLSLGYGLLRVKVESALQTVGLDPYVGFFHTDRPGRASLSLDLMEELRCYMVDRFVISIINRKQVDPNDFIKKENGAVLFCEEGFKKFIELWNNRNQEVIKHPFLEESLEIGLIPYAQAMLLSRTIRGDIELYPPFMMN